MGRSPERRHARSWTPLELTVTIEEWLGAMPGFRVSDPESTEWTAGAVRGPESVLFETEGAA